MIVVGKQRLEDFKSKHQDACSHVDSWWEEVEDANWQTPQAIKQRYSSASFLKDNQIVFNIRGNRYRLKVKINYEQGIVLIINIGTHQEYNKW